MKEPDSPPRPHVFRARFFPLFLAMAVYTQALFAVVFWGLGYVDSIRFSAPFPATSFVISYVVTSIGVTVLLLPVTLLMRYVLPSKVTPDGLSTPNAYGMMVTATWAEVTGVKAFPFPGLPYLVLPVATSRQRLWLPLFLGRMDEFTELVGRFAGTEHILYQALWPRVEQK